MEREEFLEELRKVLVPDGGGNSLFGQCVGKRIISAAIKDDQLRLEFEDGVKLILSDQMQNCCEMRHMSVDSDLEHLVGGLLYAYSVDSHTSNYDENSGDAHDTLFVSIKTSKGQVTVVNHNEHNGYYGGFDVEWSIT